MTDRVTFATATGLPLVALAFHFGTALIALVAGSLAIAVRKGGKWHRKSGTVFVYTMIASGIVAAGIAAYEGKGTITGGAFTAYLVFTAYTTVKPLPRGSRRLDIALMTMAFAVAAVGYTYAFIALGRPRHQLDGVPAGMMFFLNTVVLLAAIGDARKLWGGGIQGTRRVARHLWRMCFGLFIASGSFFLGQMKFVPEPVRIVPLMFALALFPLVLLLYWMWRVRVRGDLRGMIIAKPIEARPPA